MSNFAYMSGTGNNFLVGKYDGPVSEIQIIALVSDSEHDVDGVIFVEPINEDARGAINHFFCLNWSNICTSSNWAIINAVPEPIAILTEIKSAKFVEKISVNKIPIVNPI